MQDEVTVSQADIECAIQIQNCQSSNFAAHYIANYRHQAERETLARMEPVAWQVTFESASGRQWCRKIVLTEPDPKDWDSVTPLYALPPAPEAGQ